MAFLTRKIKMNCEIKQGFERVFIWPLTNLGGRTSKFFEEYMSMKFKVRVQFLEELVHNSNTIDLIFALESGQQDFEHRESYGIKLIEDIYWSNQGSCYPSRLVKYIN